jgi:ceramide glucosyltransferase
VILVVVLLLLATLGVSLTLLATLLTCLMLNRNKVPRQEDTLPNADRTSAGSPSNGAGTPRVSILKPLCGLEDGLEENLCSFAHLRGVSFEVVLSVASEKDPCLEIVHSILRRFPESPFVLVVGGITPGLVANPKVERLIAASRVARGDIFFISDANIRVSPEDIARTVSVFDDPSVGGVSNLFVAEGARTLGAAIESLYLLTFVMPGCVAASAAGATCAVGKSMAITREVCDRIGGFESFADLLAEDQAIALSVRSAGLRWELSLNIVRNIIVTRTLGQALARQIRWGKIRYSFSRAIYTAELLVNPVPLSILAVCAAAALAHEWLGYAAAFTTLLSFLRCLEAGLLSRLSGARLARTQILLAPFQEILRFGTWLAPFFSKEVVWRDHRARLGRGTLMLPSSHVVTDDNRVPGDAGLKWGRLP